MAEIKKIKIDDTEYDIHAVYADEALKHYIGYGTCSTAAETAEKVVIISDTNWTLKIGSIITVKFTNTNTAASPTLNVNGTGAKSIYYNNAVYTSSSSYGGYKNRHIVYQYDGTNWVFISWGYDTNSDTKVEQSAAITTAGEYPVILAYSTSTDKVTNTVKKTSTLKYNPSTRILTAPIFQGALKGTADAATKATLDSDDNNIVATYETKGEASEKLQEAKQYTDDGIAALVGTAPELLNTLEELANALNDDDKFAENVLELIGTKLPNTTTYAGSDSPGGVATSAVEFSTGTTISATGDATGTSASSKKGWSIPLTLASSGVTAGDYGPNANASPDASGIFSVPSFTVDAKGRITSASTKTITLPGDNDTKNTAGSTNSSSKLFLIGATSQAANPQTYSHDTAYVGTDGALYSEGVKVATQNWSNGQYVNTTGDTMSGALKINASNPHVHFKDTGYSTDWYIQAYQDQFGFGTTWTTAFKSDKNGNVAAAGTVTVGNAAKLQYDSTNECLNFVFS